MMGKLGGFDMRGAFGYKVRVLSPLPAMESHADY